MTGRQTHWDAVYRGKETNQVSWYQASAAHALKIIRATGLGPDASIIDIGGGASILAEELLASGFRDISVLDIAAPALAASQARLGARAGEVNWIVGDVLSWKPPRSYDLWHDRAVFHFFTGEEDRAAYRATLAAGLKPGGWLVMATFAADGPERCSNLPVHRWSPEALADELGPQFVLQESGREEHRTPWNAGQPFTWVLLRRSRP